MDPRHEYSRRLQAALARQGQLQAGEKRNRAGQAGVLLAGILMLNLVFAVNLLHVSWVAVPVLLFLILWRRQRRLLADLRRAGRQVEFYQRGLARIDHCWQGLGDPGLDWLRPDHPYALDLDLFGHASLFERLSTAPTRAGARTLADWLQEPASLEEVRARQQAVDDLRGRLDLREEMYLRAAEVPPGIDLDRLIDWAAAPPLLSSVPWRYAASGIVFVGLAALALGGLGVYLPVLLVQTALGVYWMRRVGQVIAPVDRRSRELEVFGKLLERIEREKFRAPALDRLQEALWQDGLPPSACVRKLSKLVRQLDATADPALRAVTWFLLLSTRTAFALEAWRARYGGAVARWLEALATFEALSSLAAYAYENPDDPFPEFEEAGPAFEGKELGHPLLPASQCVRNDLRLDRARRVLVITGSNMSGKSTFLRTVGVNAVLGLAGGPVRAGRLKLSRLAIGATLRIHDSLRSGQSRFYAEIARLRQLVDLGQSTPLLFLLDELLHGTNPGERRRGAAGVVRGFLDLGAIGLLTTHDLAVTELVDAVGPPAANVHFDDRWEAGKLVFDHRLKPGVADHGNALELMRAIGLRV
ncbi:MAG: DNA mismatch repair protein MutS [Gemmataceae bacterium]